MNNNINNTTIKITTTDTCNPFSFILIRYLLFVEGKFIVMKY